MSNAIKIQAHFMNENGTSKAQIARDLNVSASTVSRWIKEVEAAKVASKTIIVIDDEEPVVETPVVPEKVVQRRKVWTFVPEKKQTQNRAYVKPVQPQNAMSIAFAAAFAG